MTDFGKWLGVEKGKEMLVAFFKEIVTEEQMRAAVTTYCILFDVLVDTADWDELMHWIYDYYNDWFDNFDDLDDYMAELLV